MGLMKPTAACVLICTAGLGAAVFIGGRVKVVAARL